MIGSIFLFGVIFALSYYIYRNKYPKYKNLPPGPRGIPIFGNALQVGKHPHLQFNKWADEYGDMFSVQMGPLRWIVIRDLKLLKEVYSQSDYSGKWDINRVNDVYDEADTAHGIINAEGENWEQLRRFTLRQLRDFGFGKNSMESYIMDEVTDLLDWIKSNESKPIGDVKRKFILAVVSALWTIVNGQRLSHDDKTVLSLAHGASDALKEAMEKGGLVFFAQWLRHVIPEWSGYNRFRRVMKDMREFLTESINQHKETYSDDYSRDFIDIFLKEIKQAKDPKSPFYKEEGEKRLVGTVADLFMAGSDTTSTTLAWTILYLTTFPEVQKKMQDEIKTVTNNSRYCSLSDRPNLPYVESVIAEVLRFSTLVPGGAPHKAYVTKEVNGYTIPKGSLVVANMHYIHFDPKIWGDPLNFRPERFLEQKFDSSKKLVSSSFKKHEALIPFSIGRRQCLGEAWARDTLYLFVTNIFQKFHVELSGPATLEPEVGVVLQPKQFYCIFHERQ